MCPHDSRYWYIPIKCVTVGEQMLLNPINRMLFEYGYDGHKNLNEYWHRNRTDFLEYLRRKAPHLLNDPRYLVDFEAGLRWSTYMGIALIWEVERVLTHGPARRIVDFTGLQVRSGNVTITPDDFSAANPLEGKPDRGQADMRGIYLILRRYTDIVIRNADFSYGSFNSSIFTRVRFENCRFSFAGFGNAELHDCVFDERCTLDSVDFSDAYVAARFHSPLTAPVVSVLTRGHVVEILMRENMRFIDFSEVHGDSFIQQCRDTHVAEYIARLQILLQRLSRIRDASLLRRLGSIVWMLLRPLPPWR